MHYNIYAGVGRTNNMFLSLLLSVLLAGNAFSNSLISPCKPSDLGCVEKSINAAIPSIITGIPALQIDSSDPLFVKEIEGNLSILKYKFFNTTIIGYKNCKVHNVKLDEGLSSLHYDLQCPSLKMDGVYEINGRLIVLPVEGNGDFQLITGKYLTTVDSELKKLQGNDGKSHIAIKNFKLINLAQGPIKFDFKNLFNGQKELSDTVHKFANENWAEVAALVQDPVFYTAIKHIIKNVNKYLETVPMDEYVLN